MVLWLLVRGARRDLKDYEGKTPGERARESSEEEIALLIEQFP